MIGRAPPGAAGSGRAGLGAVMGPSYRLPSRSASPVAVDGTTGREIRVLDRLRWPNEPDARPRPAASPGPADPRRVAGARPGSPRHRPRGDRPASRHERRRRQVPPGQHQRQARRRRAPAAPLARHPEHHRPRPKEDRFHHDHSIHRRPARSHRPDLALDPRRRPRRALLRRDARAAARLHLRRPRLLRRRRHPPVPAPQGRGGLAARARSSTSWSTTSMPRRSSSRRAASSSPARRT